MYQWTQPAIIIALIGLVPWTVLNAVAMAGDSLARWRSQRSPRQMPVTLRQFERVPEILDANHEALLALSFEPIAVDETGDGKEWLYRHAEYPMLLAVLNEDPVQYNMVEFVTRFADVFVITTSNGIEEFPMQTPGLILNNIDDSISDAFQAHLEIAGGEADRRGAPLPLDTPDDYQAWMSEFRAVIRHNSPAGRWQQISMVLLVAATMGGFVGLLMMSSETLGEAPATWLALVMWAVIVLQVRWILRPPWERAPVKKVANAADTL